MAIDPGNKVTIQSSMIKCPLMNHNLGKNWKMQPKVDRNNLTNINSCDDYTCQVKEIKIHGCQVKRSSQISRILPASCLQHDNLSAPHKSVYFSTTRILVCSCLNTHVHRSEHEELKKLHLEQSFTVYWNVCCGWKLSLGRKNHQSSIQKLCRWLKISECI